MKKLLLMFVGVLIALPSFAQDFTYEYEGQTLTYTVLDEDAKTCRVKSGAGVSGAVIIPEIAKNDATNYAVTSIGDYAFCDCTGLTSVTIPNSVTSIGNNAFSGCSGLTSVTIGTAVETIGEAAFSGCSSLTSIEIPKSVTSIGDGVFAWCPKLETINVEESNSDYTSIDGVLYNIDKTKLIQHPGGKTGSFSIPNSVTSIGNHAFYGCTGLTSIEIPNSVSSISNYAFGYCISLTSIEIPNSVTYIGEAAFLLCSSLTSVTIPNSVTSIGEAAFARCTELTLITIPNSVTSIGKGAFLLCRGLTSLEIPNSVTSIGEAAFQDCSGLASVTIPNSVTSIGGFAFNGCSGLTSITIGKAVETIGDRAFYSCENLKTLFFNAENCTQCGEWADNNKVAPVFPKNLENIYIGETVTNIPDLAFIWSSIESIKIPDSVKTIGSYAFYGCSGLTSVNIPNSVTEIGSGAFYSCYLLQSVYYAATEPIEGKNNLFSAAAYNNATLYVPEEAVAKCKQIDPWKNFANIEAHDFTGVDAIADDAVVGDEPCEVYNLNGVMVGTSTENLSPGLYIVRQGGNVKKTVVK